MSLSRTRLLLAGCLLLLGCEGKAAAVQSTAVPAKPASTKSSAPLSEPGLGKLCSTDSDCDATAPRCLAFSDDAYVARPETAAIMHCSRTCDRVECPADYGCKRAPVITGLAPQGQIAGVA